MSFTITGKQHMNDTRGNSIAALGCWAHSGAGPTSSFHVSTAHHGILVDLGVDPIGQMMRMERDLAKCDYIFASHPHSDHVSGFCNFIFTRELLGRGKDSFDPNITVLGNAETIAALQTMLGVQYPDRKFQILWRPVRAGDVVDLNSGYSMQFANTKHTVPCLSLRLEGPDISVAYTGDSAPFDGQAEFFAEVDVLIGEAFGTLQDLGRGVNQKGHMLAEDTHDLAVKANAKLVIPFHFTEIYRDPMKLGELLSACASASGDGPKRRVHDPVSDPVFRF